VEFEVKVDLLLDDLGTLPARVADTRSGCTWTLPPLATTGRGGFPPRLVVIALARWAHPASPSSRWSTTFDEAAPARVTRPSGATGRAPPPHQPPRVPVWGGVSKGGAGLLLPGEVYGSGRGSPAPSHSRAGSLTCGRRSREGGGGTG
jgi:hypothetical protein